MGYAWSFSAGLVALMPARSSAAPRGADLPSVCPCHYTPRGTLQFHAQAVSFSLSLSLVPGRSLLFFPNFCLSLFRPLALSFSSFLFCIPCPRTPVSTTFFSISQTSHKQTNHSCPILNGPWHLEKHAHRSLPTRQCWNHVSVFFQMLVSAVYHAQTGL